MTHRVKENADLFPEISHCVISSRVASLFVLETEPGNAKMKNPIYVLFGLVLVSTSFAPTTYAETAASDPAKAADARLQLVALAETGSTTATIERVRQLVESY